MLEEDGNISREQREDDSKFKVQYSRPPGDRENQSCIGCINLWELITQTLLSQGMSVMIS